MFWLKENTMKYDKKHEEKWEIWNLRLRELGYIRGRGNNNKQIDIKMPAWENLAVSPQSVTSHGTYFLISWSSGYAMAFSVKHEETECTQLPRTSYDTREMKRNRNVSVTPTGTVTIAKLSACLCNSRPRQAYG